MQRLTLTLFALLSACEPGAPARHVSEPSPASEPEPDKGLIKPGPEPTARPAAPSTSDEVIVAIGDLHGDLLNTRKALRLAGLIDADDHWAGGKKIFVQTGDAIDRGDDDKAILDLLERLRDEAEQAGGRVVLLSGNHEVMNVALDFRYVTPGSNVPFSGEAGRIEAFKPGGPYARLLAERPIYAKVGDSVFVHGGILPNHVSYGLERINDEVRAWMLGESGSPDSINAVDAPVWTRLLSDGSEDPAECEMLAGVLSTLGVRRMVVGHTPQQMGITSGCDGRVWRIDVGLARFYGGPVQALEIQGDSVRVLKE